MDQLLIVGGGLAGAILSAEANQRGIDFKWIISEKIPPASFAAYGMCNPVHFKNKVPTWRADDMYQLSKSYFYSWHQRLSADFFQEMPVHHLVVDPSELVQWRQNVEITDLWKYTDGEVKMEILPFVQSGFTGSIRINESFFVTIPKFVQEIRALLADHIEYSNFDQSAFTHGNDGIQYQNRSFQKIIFSEGYPGCQNPYFQQIPFNPCKGQILVVEIPGLELEEALHKKIVLVPLGNHRFICGATYEWDDLTNEPTLQGAIELKMDLEQILADTYSFKILDQKAGVRPTISDRRPVVGWHPAYPHIGILNGFGTRGLLVGPSCVMNLMNNWLQDEPILADWDVQRFKKRMLKTV